MLGVGACASTLEREDGPAEGLTLIFPKYRGAAEGDGVLGPDPEPEGTSALMGRPSLSGIGRGNAVARAVVSLHDEIRSLASYEAIESGRMVVEVVRFLARLLGWVQSSTSSR